MTIKRCKKNGRPGFKWGKTGTVYTYTTGDPRSRKRARQKAEAQGRSQQRKDEN